METPFASDLIVRLRELGPFADDASASRALVATLQGITDFLAADERAVLRRALPVELHGALTTARPRSPSSPDDFYRHVAAWEGIRPGIAVEHAEVVCRALREILPNDVRARLERAVPGLAAFFAVRPRPEPVSGDEQALGAPHDLAEGRPGGGHPLASSDPALAAHRHSVARSADPHADSKLSSSPGLTQEREGHSLATGRPGSRRPISSNH